MANSTFRTIFGSITLEIPWTRALRSGVEGFSAATLRRRNRLSDVKMDITSIETTLDVCRVSSKRDSSDTSVNKNGEGIAWCREAEQVKQMWEEPKLCL